MSMDVTYWGHLPCIRRHDIWDYYKKGYPHSMMILAYLRMKFSSEKMNKERVMEPLTPGRLMWVARLAACRSDWSPPGRPMASSVPVPSTAKLAILQEQTQNVAGQSNRLPATPPHIPTGPTDGGDMRSTITRQPSPQRLSLSRARAFS